VVAGAVISAGVNDTLSITVDGIVTSVTIPAGAYTTAGLNSAIQSAINGNSSVSAAGSSVAVTDAAGVITVTSNKYGTSSSVTINGGSAAAGLFGLTTSTVGVDVAGTINGFAATGSGQKLTGVDGLVVTVNGGILGNRGSINFARGYGYLLSTAASSYLGTSGTITNKQDGINKSIDTITQKRAQLGLQLTAIEKRYRAQYSALDATISGLNATSNFLTQQLSVLNKSTS
jgi:flagellar hook-associated protein 2